MWQNIKWTYWNSFGRICGLHFSFHFIWVYSFCLVTVKTFSAHRLARCVFNVRADYSCLGSCSFSYCCLWISLTLDGFTRSPQELQFARAEGFTGLAELSTKDKLVKTHCLLDGVSPRPLGYAAGSVRIVAFICFCLDRFAGFLIVMEWTDNVVYVSVISTRNIECYGILPLSIIKYNQALRTFSCLGGGGRGFLWSYI
jgi:hypothetical protein